MKIDVDKAKELFTIPDELRDIIMEETIFCKDNPSERFELFVEQGLTYTQEQKVYNFIYKTINDRIVNYGRHNAECSIAEAEQYIADTFDIDTTEYQKSQYYSYGWNGYSIDSIGCMDYIAIKPVCIGENK